MRRGRPAKPGRACAEFAGRSAAELLAAAPTIVFRLGETDRQSVLGHGHNGRMSTSTPNGADTSAGDVLEILALARECGARLWIDGGWGVDALLGGQTRSHGDLDVAVEARHVSALESRLLRAGFRRCEEPGATAWNFLMSRPGGAVLDLHVIELDDAGNGVLGPPEQNAVYPGPALTGHGVIAGQDVDCISPEGVVAFHDAYRGNEKDRQDVRAVCARFGIGVPEQYR